MSTVQIATAMYNAVATVADTVRSVREQTFGDFSWLILDDGSSDDSVEVARRAAAGDARIHVEPQGRVGHIGVLRNRSLRKAQSRYVSFIDADDQWLPTFLASQLESLERRRASVVHCAAMHLIDGKEVLPVRTFAGPEVCEPPLMFEILMRSNPIYSPSVVLRTDVFQAAGGFSERAEHFSTLDFDLWVRLSPYERFAYNPRRLLRYRISGNSLSFSPKNRTRNLSGDLLSLEDSLARGERISKIGIRLRDRHLAQRRGDLGRAMLESGEGSVAAACQLIRLGSEAGSVNRKAQVLAVVSQISPSAPKALGRLLRARTRAVFEVSKTVRNAMGRLGSTGE